MIQRSGYVLSSSLRKSFNKSIKAYLNVLGGLPFPVLITDMKGIIRYINGEIAAISASRPTDIIDTSLQTLFPGLQGKRSYTVITQLVKTRKLKTVAIILEVKKTRMLELLITARPFGHDQGMPLTEIYFNVIREQPQTWDLKGIQRKYRDLQMYSHTGFWELNRNRSQFSLSDECMKLLDIHNASGTVNYTDLLESLPRKEDKQNIEKGLIAITNTSHEFETEIRVKKSVRDLSESLTLRFIAWWNNEAPGYKGILQDITKDKKVMKELLKAKEKAERSDRLKSHFLTNLSYEIRTPMNAILGFAELLNLEDLTIEQKLDYTRIIRQKGNTLLTMIDDGIELSKFETGNIPINKTEFEIYPLLKELYSDCEQKRIELAKNNIKVELVDPEEIKNEKIFTDSGRLQQMLSNLLSNALKFTEKGEIEFGYKKSGKFHKFYVKDTGIGIPKEDQNIIFNRFQEIEETSSKRYTGGGMNLTISKHIVELLGGKIKVKSEVNKGSRFQISIPVESSKNKISDMTEFDDTKTVNWKDRVILIAEDEDINFRFLEAILQKTQAQILRAGTGKESVELCRNIQKIDLVLMDIKMPDINGLEATKEIKSLRPSLPVIAQTAFATQEELNKCQESGCDDIITKPIDIKLLIRKINDLLQ